MSVDTLYSPEYRYSRSEYITIASIMICMTVWDFVIGVIFGIVISCKHPQYFLARVPYSNITPGVFFVVQSSRRQSIRVLHTGETVMSTVRRPSAHRAYIREVSKQTTIMRLQGSSSCHVFVRYSLNPAVRRLPLLRNNHAS